MDPTSNSKQIVWVNHLQVALADLPAGVVCVPSPDPKDSSKVSPTVEILDDPALIAWTRQACEADLDKQFAIAIEQVRTGRLCTAYAYLAVFKQRRVAAVNELRQIMSAGETPIRERMLAAALLARFKATDGEEFLLAALESPAVELCAAAVEALRSPAGGIDIQRSELAARLFKLLSHPDPEIVKEVATLCTIYKVPGVETALREVVTKGQGPLDELAERLASCATTSESVRVALPYLFGKRVESFGALTYWGFWQVIDNPDPSISCPLREALRRHLLTYEGDVRLDSDWVRNLTRVADESVVPVLEDVIARAKNPLSREAALEGICRARPREAVDRILEETRCHDHGNIPLRLLYRYATEENSERIIEYLYPLLSVEEKRWIYLDEAQLLLGRLGQRGQEFIQRNKHRLDATAAEWVAWKLRGLVAYDALADLHKAGVIPEVPEELFERVAREGSISRESQPEQLLSALRFSDTVTVFGRKGSDIPAPHQDLIRYFAANSKSRFNPEDPMGVAKISCGDQAAIAKFQ